MRGITIVASLPLAHYAAPTVATRRIAVATEEGRQTIIRACELRSAWLGGHCGCNEAAQRRNQRDTSISEAVPDVREAATMLDIRATSPHSRRSFRKRADGAVSGDRSRYYSVFRRSDRLLSEDEEPPLGAHLVTPRLGFDHHGIYVGQGIVIHYGTLARGLRRRPVEEVNVAHFARGHPVWHRSSEHVGFDGEEVTRRARSRLGEDRYHLFTNNCEHFCEWCVYGQHRSYQVEELLGRPKRVLGTISTRALTQFAVRSILAAAVTADPAHRTILRNR